VHPLWFQTPEGDGFVIDRAKVEADARFDGLFVLRTNTKIAALQVVLRYRNLLAVEDAFETAKALLATRPTTRPTPASAATSSAPSSPSSCARS
jgi:hypothetical protein